MASLRKVIRDFLLENTNMKEVNYPGTDKEIPVDLTKPQFRPKTDPTKPENWGGVKYPTGEPAVLSRPDAPGAGEDLEKAWDAKKQADKPSEDDLKKSREAAKKAAAENPPLKEKYESVRAEHTVSTYNYSEERFNAIAEKLKAKVPTTKKEGYDYAFEGDIIQLANLHAKEIASKGRHSKFSLQTFKTRVSPSDMYNWEEEADIEKDVEVDYLDSSGEYLDPVPEPTKRVKVDPKTGEKIDVDLKTGEPLGKVKKLNPEEKPEDVLAPAASNPKNKNKTKKKLEEARKAIDKNPDFKPKNIDEIVTFTIEKGVADNEYTQYILEVLARAYKGATTLTNGQVTKTKELKGGGEETFVENQKVVIGASKDDLLAAIAAFFEISGNSGYSAMKTNITGLLKWSKKVDISAIEEFTSPDEFRDGLVYGWMKLFGDKEIIKRKLKNEFSDDDGGDEAYQAEIDRIENKITLSNKDNSSLYYYVMGGISKGTIDYFRLKSMKLNKQQQDIAGTDFVAPGSGRIPGYEYEDDTQEALSNPNAVEKFMEISEKIYNKFERIAPERQLKAWFDTFVAIKPATEAYIDSVEDTLPEDKKIDFYLMRINTDSLNKAAKKANPESGEALLKDAIAKSKAEGELEPLKKFARSIGIEEFKPKTAKELEKDIAELANIYGEPFWKDPTAIGQALRDFIKTNLDTINKMYMEEPTFVKWVEEIGPTGQRIQKRVPKINLVGGKNGKSTINQITKQAGTDYGSDYDTSEETSGKQYSTKYQQRRQENKRKMDAMVNQRVNMLKKQVAEFNVGVEADLEKKIEDIKSTSNFSFDKDEKGEPKKDENGNLITTKKSDDEINNLIQQARNEFENRKMKPTEKDLLNMAREDVREKDIKDSELKRKKKKKDPTSAEDLDYVPSLHFDPAIKGNRPNQTDIEKSIADAKHKQDQEKTRMKNIWKEIYMEEVIKNVMKRLIKN